MNKQLQKIADHYGKDAQAVQCAEVLCELSCAILQYRKRKGRKELGKVMEEMADVENMLPQMKYLYDIGSDFIEELRQEKVDRQLLRIESEGK